MNQLDKPNSGELSCDGSVMCGVRRVRAFTKSPVLFVGHVAISLRRSHGRGEEPCVERGRLLAARPAWHHGKPVLIGADVWRGYILYIDAKSLCFDDERSSRLPVKNAWPGAETDQPAFVQVGSRKDHRQYQLVTIDHGCSAIVGDGSGRYITLRCRDRILTSEKTTPHELGLHLVRRAERRLHHTSALQWTLDTLRALGVSEVWGRGLDERLRRQRALTR